MSTSPSPGSPSKLLWFLGQGLWCVAVMLAALVAARWLASDPQRVCAASLPARMT
jgi:hypothetical protein